MLGAGVAWGIYSLRGRRSRDPLRDTAGNFIRAAPGALLLSAVMWRQGSFDGTGVLLAALSADRAPKRYRMSPYDDAGISTLARGQKSLVHRHVISNCKAVGLVG